MSKIIGEYCILLTACVNPNGMSQTTLQNVNVRRQQYIDAINYYLTKTKFRIVFVENSGNDLSLLFIENISNERIEFITFEGNDYNRELGKGYGEAMLIKYAMEHSTFLQECKFIVKITGRLMLKNIYSLVWEHSLFYRKSDVSVFFYCLDLIDSRFFVTTRDFLLNSFLPKATEINDSRGVYFEHVLDNSLTLNSDVFLLHIPMFEGVSGSSGNAYEHISIVGRRFWRYKKVNLMKLKEIKRW